jgi:hypothetical protein
VTLNSDDPTPAQQVREPLEQRLPLLLQAHDLRRIHRIAEPAPLLLDRGLDRSHLLGDLGTLPQYGTDLGIRVLEGRQIRLQPRRIPHERLGPSVHLHHRRRPDQPLRAVVRIPHGPLLSPCLRLVIVARSTGA